MDKLLLLPINQMNQRHPGLTKAVSDSYHEALRVCLTRHHVSPTDFKLKAGKNEKDVRLEWEAPDESILGAWNNEIDATEAGAYACALAAVELEMGKVAVRRAETLTGADYYIADNSTKSDDMEDWYRLEVSGTNNGDHVLINRRLREKIEQTKKGNSNLPAVASVIGFFAKAIILESITTK